MMRFYFVAISLWLGLFPVLQAEERIPKTWKERWAEAVFERLDLNDDGQINRAEANRANAGKHEATVSVPFKALDLNKDMKLSREEFIQAVQKDRKLHFVAEDHDADLGLPYRPKAGRESVQDVGLRFKF
jgi:hypothetical protein